jgi:hypothetical protein
MFNVQIWIRAQFCTPSPAVIVSRDMALAPQVM